MSESAAKFDADLMVGEIEARLNATTPGKWKAGSRVDQYKVTVGKQNICSCYGSEADVEFIAHAPADILWLLQRIEDLEDLEDEKRDEGAIRSVRVESEGGGRIHPQCTLVVDGQEQQGVVVGAFGITFASPVVGPGPVPCSVGPLPIIEVYVETLGFIEVTGGHGA